MDQFNRSPSTQPSPRARLPIALTSFVGRERETADVAQLLASARLISLIGAGGGGKTRLALRTRSLASSPTACAGWIWCGWPILRS